MPRAKLRNAALRDRVLAVAVATLRKGGAFTTRKVATRARTSTPAVYELFGDKAGLVREMFFEGFRRLYRTFQAPSRDPRADLTALIFAFRAFIVENPELSALMFARRFVDFHPGPADLAAGAAVRELIVERVRRCLDARLLHGDATDIAHVIVSTTQGLAATELAGWLGRSKASRQRRWRLAISALLEGLRPRPRPRW